MIFRQFLGAAACGSALGVGSALAAPGTVMEIGCNRQGQIHYLSMGYADVSWTDMKGPLKGYIEVNGGDVKTANLVATVNPIPAVARALPDLGSDVRARAIDPTEPPRVVRRDGRNNVVRIPIWLDMPAASAPSSVSYTLLIETSRGSPGCHVPPPH